MINEDGVRDLSRQFVMQAKTSRFLRTLRVFNVTNDRNSNVISAFMYVRPRYYILIETDRLFSETWETSKI